MRAASAEKRRGRDVTHSGQAAPPSASSTRITPAQKNETGGIAASIELIHNRCFTANCSFGPARYFADCHAAAREF